MFLCVSYVTESKSWLPIYHMHPVKTHVQFASSSARPILCIPLYTHQKLFRTSAQSHWLSCFSACKFSTLFILPDLYVYTNSVIILAFLPIAIFSPFSASSSSHKPLCLCPCFILTCLPLFFYAILLQS